MRNGCGIELQDIFIRYGEEYRKKHGKSMPLRQHRAMRAIEICRTARMGGHVERCDSCNEMRISYNSCRNRHCPKCQFLKKEKWVENRLKDLLPIQYFHVVFTIPDDLNPIALRNQRIIYNILFRSVSETLKDLSRDNKYKTGRIGFICVLHTWGQNLSDHPHIHCIVTGGGLSDDQHKWMQSYKDFLFPIRVMATLFRGKFLAYLKQSYDKGELEFPGKIKHLQYKNKFSRLINNLYIKEWVVYSKPPFKNPETVFRYLSRYTHRIAISNQRIVKVEDGKVYFIWKDYRDGQKKEMALDAFEFIRRFLLHVLPDKFVKIRHYGLFGNRYRKILLDKCRNILGMSEAATKEADESWQEMLNRLTGIDITTCPFCSKGKMHPVNSIHPARCNGPPGMTV